jgi:hypothetical protein
MSKPQHHDFHIKQGEDWTISIKFKDNNRLPKTITGYSAKMQLRETYSGNQIIELSDTSGIVIDGPNGVMTFTIPKTVTANFTFPKALYDLRITTSSGKDSYPIEGEFICTPRVTR